jgi:hypothetical protein
MERKVHEGRKDLNSTKMDQRGEKKPRDKQKKKKSRRGHGCLSVVSAVYCQVEVSATDRSLVQRSPTECVCVSLSVIKCNNKLYTYSEYLERGQSKKEGDLTSFN